MKLKRLYNLIMEARNVGTVYHFVSIEYALSIINNDFIKAQTTHSGLKLIRSKFDENAESALSTTRDKNFENIRQKFAGRFNDTNIGGVDVMFVLDGTKMSNKYKTIAYDDFKDRRNLKMNESEQLWYGSRLDRDRGIKNASTYIDKVVITDEFTGTLKTTGRLRKYTDELSLFKDFISALEAKNVPYEFEDKDFDLSKLEENLPLMNVLRGININKYKIRNGYIDVFHNIDMAYLQVIESRLRPFKLKLGTINGDFRVYESSIKKDLVGSPTKVIGVFTCLIYELKSLKGAPEFIKGGFSVSSTNLKSLKYFPKYLEGYVNLQNNELQSMVGLPDTIYGDLNIKHNPLKSLKGLPKKITGSLMISGYRPSEIRKVCDVKEIYSDVSDY